jgi:hypothetical protein
MRAEGLVSFPVPVAGLIKNMPPQNVPGQGLLDGLNMFVDQDGFLKPRFGYSPFSGLSMNSLAGTVQIAAGSTTATVTLPVVQPNANYPIILAVRPSASAPDVQVVWSTRTTSQFTVTISADPGGANTVNVDWYIPTGTDVSGVASFASGVTSVAVVFAVPQTASNYMIAFGVGLGTGSPPAVTADYDSPTVNGFNLNISADPGGGNTILVAWQIFFPDAVANTTHGKVTFTGATTQVAVTLATPQTDTSYFITLGVKRGTPGGIDVGAVYASPTTTGFNIRISAAPGTDTVEVDWHLARLVIANVGQPVLGGIGFYDATGTLQYVIATQNKWYRLSTSPLTWVDITDPANPNTGTLDNQVRFVAFPYLGNIWVLGVNNTDPMRSWRPGLATYQTVTQAPICRDIEVIASRVMGINTLEGGTRYSYRVRWSNIDDFTTWQASSDQDLTDMGQPLVKIKRTKVSGAAIYGITGVTIATAQPGTDATAFRFDEIQQPETPGPCGPSALASAVGNHYYLGLDARVYQFDGTSVVPISGQIDALLQQVVSLNFAGRFHAVYWKGLRQIWFFFVRSPDTEPRWAAVYQVDAQRFEPLQQIADQATTSFATDEMVTLSWLTWASATDTWLTLPYPSWSAIPGGVGTPIMVLGLSDGRVERFGFATTDDSIPIPYRWVSSLQRLDPNSRQLANAWDIFFQKQPVVGDLVTSTLSILAHPTATPVIIQGGSVSWDPSIDTPVGYYPGANKPVSGYTLKLQPFSNVPPNEDVYLQMTLSGTTSKRLVSFGGAEVFAYTERRA